MLKLMILKKIWIDCSKKAATPFKQLPVVVLCLPPPSLGEIGDISRFTSPGALAKYAGCAPRERSSGKKIRHVKSRSGNRRLNCAFHRMALSQISRSGNEKAKVYFKRKISEGKSKNQALVCLRRQIVNIVWMMMKHKTVYRNA